MSTETKRYRLLKDLPDAKAGDIYVKRNPNGDTYVNQYTLTQKSPVIEHNNYFSWQVETSPEWFIEEHICQYCKAWTSQPDEECYKYPSKMPKQEERVKDNPNLTTDTNTVSKEDADLKMYERVMSDNNEYVAGWKDGFNQGVEFMAKPTENKASTNTGNAETLNLEYKDGEIRHKLPTKEQEATTDKSDVVCLSLNDLLEIDHSGNGKVLAVTHEKLMDKIKQKLNTPTEQTKSDVLFTTEQYKEIWDMIFSQTLKLINLKK